METTAIEHGWTNALATGIVVALLAAVYPGVRVLAWLDAGVQRGLLAACAGTSLAYVMLYLLPKLADKQAILSPVSADTATIFAQHRSYLLALVGMIVYLLIVVVGSHKAVWRSRDSSFAVWATRILPPTIYGSYSALIAYLVVHRLDVDLVSLGLITLAVATLFLINANGLREADPSSYDRRTCWILAVAVLIGYGLGQMFTLRPVTIALWFAFLAGIMIFSTINEKLSQDRAGGFLPFVGGIVAMTLLIVGFE